MRTAQQAQRCVDKLHGQLVRPGRPAGRLGSGASQRAAHSARWRAPAVMQPQLDVISSLTNRTEAVRIMADGNSNFTPAPVTSAELDIELA